MAKRAEAETTTDPTKRSYLYMLTCRPTGKSYVGVTSMPVRDRWVIHVCMAKEGKRETSPIYNAIREHGEDAFDVITLAEGEWRYIERLEDPAIVGFGTMRPEGYNARAGGLDGSLSEESASLVSEKAKKRYKDPRAREKTARAAKAHHSSPAEILKRRIEAKRPKPPRPRW